MVILRNKPASLSIGATLLYPGAQFLADETFDHLKRTYKDFEAMLKSKDLVALVPPSKPVTADKSGKKLEKPEWPNAKTCIVDEIKALSAEDAVEVVKKLIDSTDITDVQAADTRKAVRLACESQWEGRKNVMRLFSPGSILNPNMAKAKEPIFSTTDPEIREAVEGLAGSRIGGAQ